jgi:two-component system alkaline phosphatase synthesis response regulator PhoP
MVSKILIVDDEPSIIEMLSYNLKQANFEVITAKDGKQALERTRSENPDLIILDLMLPILDGLDVCRILRRERDIPIIMVTAKGTEIDRVVGLELGADDYIVKPFSVRELIARVKTVLRRTSSLNHTPAEEEPIELGVLKIIPTRREAYLDQQLLSLTALEFDLLYFFARHPGQVFSRDHLLQRVWEYDFPGDQRVVDAAVKRLRKKLNQVLPNNNLIQTVRGVGYKISYHPESI